MWVQSILSSRVKHSPFRTALSVSSICWETSHSPSSWPKSSWNLQGLTCCYQEKCWGWFLMRRKVFKGKCLAPSIKIMIVQLTLKSSTVLLLAEGSWGLLKAQLNKGGYLGVQLSDSTNLCQLPCKTKDSFCFSRAGSWTPSASSDKGIKEQSFQYSDVKALAFVRLRLSI